MSDLIDLKQYIRFALDQMKIQNKHHDFEHLCRQFSRLRICSNILPATGPVSDGGDQGRDFETFRSYIQSTPIANSSFIGIGRGKAIVFACTLTAQSSIISKIRLDCKKICASPRKPDEVIYFCVEDISVSKRDKLIRWAKNDLGIDFQLFDGNALSELLCEVDIFWLAERYLDVPSELFPRSENIDSEYISKKKKWIDEKYPPQNHADFSEIRLAMREAIFDQEKKPDLPSWIKVIEVFLDPKSTLNLSRKAQYEICVTSLRGINDLGSKKDLIISYFSDITKLTKAVEIEDALNLLIYCTTAKGQGHLDLPIESLQDWTDSFLLRLDTLLSNATGNEERGRLLKSKAGSAFIPLNGKDDITTRSNKAIKNWHLMLDVAKLAPLFPLGTFSDTLTSVAPMLGNNLRFQELVERTDKELSKRSGGLIAGEKSRDRAMAYLKAKKYILAIKELHKSKIYWYTADSLKGTILSMLLLADIYGRLSLCYAAKYYASCVVFLAHGKNDDEIKNYIAVALFKYIDFLYLAGESSLFVQISGIAVSAHCIYESDPLNLETHSDLRHFLVHYSVLTSIAAKGDEKIAAWMKHELKNFSLDQKLKDELLVMIEDKDNHWNKTNIEDIWATAESQLVERPFSDLGHMRNVQWSALGVIWTVTFANRYEETAVAESIISALQIMIADFAEFDLVIIPTEVKLEIVLKQNGNEEVIPVDSGVAEWKVLIPRDYGSWTDDRQNQLNVAIAFTTLAVCSALKRKDLEKILESSAKNGLISKTFSVRPTAEIFKEIISKKTFEEFKREIFEIPFGDRPFKGMESSELVWRKDLGPGYSQAQSKNLIENRYENCLKSLRATLPRLIEDIRINKEIMDLRAEGFLDWHILTSIANLAANYRVQLEYGAGVSPVRLEAGMRAQLYREETKSSPIIPLEIFTKDDIKMQSSILLLNYLTTWGLEQKMRVPDLGAIKRLLDARYRHSADDVPHADPFLLTERR
jgi:hypothetical protein